MNLKRQHVVGATLGGSHTPKHTHTRAQTHRHAHCDPTTWSHVFLKELQKASERGNNCSGCRRANREVNTDNNKILQMPHSLLSWLRCSQTQMHLSPLSGCVSCSCVTDADVTHQFPVNTVFLRLAGKTVYGFMWKPRFHLFFFLFILLCHFLPVWPGLFQTLHHRLIEQIQGCDSIESKTHCKEQNELSRVNMPTSASISPQETETFF